MPARRPVRSSSRRRRCSALTRAVPRWSTSVTAVAVPRGTDASWNADERLARQDQPVGVAALSARGSSTERNDSSITIRFPGLAIAETRYWMSTFGLNACFTARWERSLVFSSQRAARAASKAGRAIGPSALGFLGPARVNSRSGR